MTDTPILQQDQRMKIEQFLRQRSRIVAESPFAVQPHPYTDKAPLTLFQQSTWVMAQIDPCVPYYNESVNVVLQNDMRIDILQRSWRALVERHEALRTSFAIVNDEPVQIIHPLAPLHAGDVFSSGDHFLLEVDFTNQPLTTQIDSSRQYAMQMANTPFDLESAPLYRGFIAHLTQGYRLYLVFHHSIFDGYSLNTIIIPELHAIYNAFTENRQHSLPPLPVHYRDYAFWEQTWQNSDIYQQHLAYWKRQLGDAPASLDLPIAHVPLKNAAHTGEIVRGILPAALTQSLRDLATNENVTLFTLLFASIQSILHRYSHNTDICIGTSSANRKVKELEHIVGALINTVVLRGDLSGNPTFIELVRRDHAIVLEALDHDSVAFERVVRELRPDHEPGKNPFFQVFMSLEPSIPAHVSGWQTRVGDFHSGASKFELYLIFEDTPQGLAYVFTYDTAIFEQVDIENFTSSWRVMLQAISQNPQTSINELDILDASEYNRIVHLWNATTRQFPAGQRLQDLFEEQANNTPDAIAVIYADAAMTYQQLNERANQSAHFLRDLGVQTGDIIGVCLDRSIDMVIALMGIMKSGAAYLPLDPEFPKDRLAMILEDSNVQFIITTPRLQKVLPKETTTPVFLNEALSVYPASNPVNRTQPDDIVYILYTSGSTGRPKGVQITHRNITNFLLSMQQEPCISSCDVVLAITTISFDIAGLEIWLPLVSGAACVIVPAEIAMNGEAIQDIIRRHHVTFIQATPVSWSIWLQSGWSGTQKMKILCGGEALSRELAEQLLPLATSLWNMYGPTETTVWSTLKHITAPQNITVGKPIANTQCYILDSFLQPVPNQVIGDLYIGGEGVARGYFNRPDLNNERFLPNPFAANSVDRMYKTGDIARYSANGEIEFLGRSDFQVKVRGFRIELGEIESALRKYKDTADAVVIVREDAPGDKRIVGYVISRTGDSLNIEGLLKYVAKILPHYMVPNTIVILEAFPRTPNQKIDRKALPAPAIHPIPEMEPSSESWTETEQRLANIWSQLLKNAQIQLHDSFFALGGHSLLGAMLMRHIEAEFNRKIPLTVLFHHKTLAELASYIDQIALNQAQSASTSMPTIAVNISPDSTHADTDEDALKNLPIFFIHSDWAGGGLYSEHIAAQMPEKRPFYILDVDQTKPLPTTMEELASWHIETIRAIQPTGPYTISGFCIGGLVAFEIAKQLQRDGNAIASLVMIDSAASPQSLRIAQKLFASKQPDYSNMKRFLKVMQAHSFAEHILMRSSAIIRSFISKLALEALMQEEDPYFAYRKSIATEHENAAIASELSASLQSMYSWLYAGYIPGQYDGAIDLIIADKERLIQLQTPEREWTSRTRNLRIHTTPGTHISCRTDYVGELGATFSQCLSTTHVGPA